MDKKNYCESKATSLWCSGLNLRRTCSCVRTVPPSSTPPTRSSSLLTLISRLALCLLQLVYLFIQSFNHCLPYYRYSLIFHLIFCSLYSLTHSHIHAHSPSFSSILIHASINSGGVTQWGAETVHSFIYSLIHPFIYSLIY